MAQLHAFARSVLLLVMFCGCQGMRAAVAKGMSRDEIIKNVRFEKYKDVRNYYRMNLFISSYYHLLTTGKPQNAYP